jgi:hypothetical protein
VEESLQHEICDFTSCVRGEGSPLSMQLSPRVLGRIEAGLDDRRRSDHRNLGSATKTDGQEVKFLSTAASSALALRLRSTARISTPLQARTWTDMKTNEST